MPPINVILLHGKATKLNRSRESHQTEQKQSGIIKLATVLKHEQDQQKLFKPSDSLCKELSIFCTCTYWPSSTLILVVLHSFAQAENLSRSL